MHNVWLRNLVARFDSCIYTVLSLAWRRLQRVCDGSIRRRNTPLSASDGASDREIHRLTGAMGRLDAEDVRWDVIGAAHSGKRHRI